MNFKKGLLTILVINICLYFLFGNIMLEKELFNEFQEFSQRRLENKYNDEAENVYEQFYFSSCGDEYFRNTNELEKQVNISNYKRYNKYKDMDDLLSITVTENEYKPILAYKTDYHEDRFKYIEKEGNINIIHFAVCKIKNIPLFYSKIELREIFSTHKDFHAMHYNGQNLRYEVDYIWVLFKWFRFNKKLI